MRSASAEPCGTSPGVRFGNAAQILHSICPHSTTAAAAKRGTTCKARCNHHHCMASSNVASPSATPQATLVRKPGSATTTKAMATTAPHARVWAQFGAVTERATRNPTKVWATTSDACKDEPPGTVHTAACGPAVIPTTTVLSRRAADGTLLATTSAAANRGRDEPNTGRITAPASTPTAKLPSSRPGLELPPLQEISSALRCNTRWAASSASAGTPTLSWLSTRGTCRRMPSLSALHCKCPTPAAASAKGPICTGTMAGPRPPRAAKVLR